MRGLLKIAAICMIAVAFEAGAGVILERIAAFAPAGSDLASWRY
jgi:hypothetical protein